MLHTYIKCLAFERFRSGLAANHSLCTFSMVVVVAAQLLESGIVVVIQPRQPSNTAGPQ